MGNRKQQYRLVHNSYTDVTRLYPIWSNKRCQPLASTSCSRLPSPWLQLADPTASRPAYVNLPAASAETQFQQPSGDTLRAFN